MLYTALPPAFGSMQQLERLDLAKTSMRGPPPSTWAKLTRLKFLNVSGCSMGSSSPTSAPEYSIPQEWLMGMTSLEVLSCKGCRLAGNLSGLDTPGAFPMLRVLELDMNALGGPLPTGG
jgi:hypothetical protein